MPCWEEGFDQFRKSSHCVKNRYISLYNYPLHNPILVLLWSTAYLSYYVVPATLMSGKSQLIL
ncbi:TPA: hypothetical protein HL449_19420 [Escherichia coli]|uniref:Uncharacterized protein n=2 Tax=Enterobacteriaceae TaxID=543 RepID=A0A0P7NUQ0_ECOLX|nr:hypothetical protein BSZ13_07810 [Escherichia coli]ATI05732.1 hypothetical protein CO715_08415 [Escherichia coli M12]EFF12195.1 conserved hypothetical protein [Escherichia coli B354]EFN8578188.1 hypothetical protein [Escherichia coli O15]EFO3122252.1 hypothetical protein [Escherichia coli O73]EFV9522206.1 hypothetical protein [Shigella sonnei]OYJ49558.1 hypothetical protein CI736_03245 [Shigella boydii]THI70144.1 hypothetical protein FAZ84_10650 [Escherichia coli K-12]